MMTTIAPGTPVVRAAGIDAAVVRPTPNQPGEGFRTIDDAVNWRQAQLWFDHGFDHAKPRQASAVAQAAAGFELLDLDRSLRIADGAVNHPVGAWAPIDDRVVAVVDGLGARLTAAGRGANGAGDAAAGAMLAARNGAPAAVALDGAAALGAGAAGIGGAGGIGGLVARVPGGRATVIGAGVGVLALGGVAAWKLTQD